MNFSELIQNIEELVETEIDLDEELADLGVSTHSHLVVYNDDHNTFDWVIQSFVEVLKHTTEQAEQLSMMVHYKGKAIVKVAPRSILRPLRTALTDRGLSAVIEAGQ
jgi:ATP-dependent Clp protease adaptor protein ClpS